MKLMDLAKQMQDPHEPEQVRYWGARIESALCKQTEAWAKKVDEIDSTFTSRQDIPWPQPGYWKSDDRIDLRAELRTLERCARDLLATSEENDR